MSQSNRCTLALVVGGEKDNGGEPGHSRSFEVAVSFDEALNRLVPISHPSSSLEARETMTWPLVAGGRLWVDPRNIAWVEELQ